jgi:MFS family permease
MNRSSIALEKPTGVRYGVLGFACALSMITYLDRVCFGTVATNIQKEFGLEEDQIGYLFTAFGLAYALFEVPSGWLGDRFGARWTLIRIVLWWSVFTALTGSIYPTPGSWLAFGLLLAVRFLFGMGEAGAYPNIARAFHNWFPFRERGFAKGAVWMAGRFAGGMTGFIVFALMFDTVATDGTKITHWRHMFYIFGAVGALWCIAWWWWYRDNPAAKSGVNAAELALIRHGTEHGQTKLVVPWRKLATSVNLWLLCGQYFFASYGWYLYITYWPGLVKELGFERGDEKWTAQFWLAGLMAGLPLLVGSVGCLVGGLLTDQFIKRTGDRKWGRRLFGALGHGLTASCFFVAAFFLHHPWIFVLLLSLAAFWNDITMGSAWASCLDIGQRYSGIVAGCMNTIGNLGGALAGTATGWIIKLHTGSLQSGSAEYDTAKYEGWVMNIVVFGAAYVMSVLCWLRFDATKPVARE